MKGVVVRSEDITFMLKSHMNNGKLSVYNMLKLDMV